MLVNSRADAVLVDFPWFSDPHGLWKGIPSFPPKAAITAALGVCRGAQLLSIIKMGSIATSDDSPLPTQTPTHTADESPIPPTGREMAPLHFDNNSPSLHDHSTPSTDKGKGHAQAMDNLMMEFDYDAGLAQGDMGMEVDEDELVCNGFIGSQKHQHPHSSSPPPNPTFVPPEKPSTPITDNCSAFHTRPTAGARCHATSGPCWLLHSLQLISAGNLAKRAKTSGAGNHIQTILNEADTIHKDKVVTLELKNDRLRIKLDHEHHHNKQAFACEEWTSEQANAVILHQHQTEKLEAKIRLQDVEARTYE
ncbi:hypothetical protein PAXRUDRAFT_16239 [Paxillus rubicundulus Ve08.2h10]|uniref:Uncharacterized protein n=1 Tax=Paxillus rubicundulus Ve08.2h10 TaxID=930991 RepID=A0A0D0D7G1_9AGAM|nr:hypothetical protein PAXRUDRAFT_16239 [Paxillus rubicundulus Ve08.2h10]